MAFVSVFIYSEMYVFSLLTPLDFSLNIFNRPELIVLFDFKAIYPGVPPGIFASFPGVAHFLSYKEICQYPKVITIMFVQNI